MISLIIDDKNLSANAIIILVSSISCGLIIVGVIALVVIAKRRHSQRVVANGYKLVSSEVEMFNKKYKKYCIGCSVIK